MGLVGTSARVAAGQNQMLFMGHVPESLHMIVPGTPIDSSPGK